ncbi:MAG: sugar phosphate isomerase/epimerase [Anaerolineae bacterium]|nr:sugar phosphate isomerase/epimerase [Anaerolineae bacterium]
MWRFAVQAGLIPGRDFHEKCDRLAAWGYDGVEVSGSDVVEQADEVRAAAQAAGIQVTSTCGGYHGWLVDPNPRSRALAVGEIQRILEAGARVGAAGLVAPAAYGISARAPLPPGRYLYTLEEERGLLLDSLAQIVSTAEQTGTTLFLEPLNRYVDRVVNTVAEAAAIIEALRSPHVRIVPDFYHMNIEEADIAATLRQYAPLIGHVHLSDSNRGIPGQGHVDFASGLAALRASGYDGVLAIEATPPADPDTAFRHALALVRQA